VSRRHVGQAVGGLEVKLLVNFHGDALAVDGVGAVGSGFVRGPAGLRITGDFTTKIKGFNKKGFLPEFSAPAFDSKERISIMRVSVRG
jgi:hypothetical protein